MTPAEQTKRSYERRPYPHPRGHALIRKRGNLPSTQWMLALGRPGLPPPQRILVAGCGTGAEAFVSFDNHLLAPFQFTFDFDP